ncbi:MAG: hypothetical protein COV52_01495 [Gammaproteobacteria bacterium CG11_big_fil_rev_8_21_14_0_20_46_22]|nr:MAG: hypothetical protein COW05_03220 [Gammaproteobacteria bacterium CG12_big_fil_rev_8_21_14_0_65_46_12]PIR11929.1 MAG: hypothetical protein COV52_01495 [Gammaproteobacteria bacterium CG11_big_fil_rev_8_21_14_0_20_46_22]
MSKKYDALPIIALSKENTYTHPEAMPELIHWDDKALNVMINFETVRPALARPKDLIDDTLVKMKSSGRLVMLVVDEDCVVGAVSSGDLQGAKPLKITQEDRIKHSEITVKMVMTPREKLLTLNYQDLRFAKVGNLIKTLRENNSRYALVVDIQEGSSEQRVHGLVNAYDIIKRLEHNPGAPMHEAHSILELKKALD